MKTTIIFKTSDGVRFYKENDAKNHAKSLKDKTVTKGQLKPSSNANSTKNTSKSDATNGADKGGKKLTPMQEAKLRKEAIEKMDTVAAVEKALEGETAKSVKDAGAKRIEALKAAAGSSDEEE